MRCRQLAGICAHLAMVRCSLCFRLNWEPNNIQTSLLCLVRANELVSDRLMNGQLIPDYLHEFFKKRARESEMEVGKCVPLGKKGA